MTAFLPLVHTDPAALVAVGEAGARTAGELVRDARAVAARLPPAREGSEVLVVCGDRYHLAVTALGAWLRGHAVALPPNAQPAAVRELAARAHVAALLHDADLDDAHDVRLWLGTGAEGHGLEDMPEGAWPEAIAAGRRLAVVYTSGSTGDHQPCAKTAGQLLGEAAALVRTFALGPADVALATVPPYHLYGLLFGVLAPLLAGGAFARETPLHAETVAAVARRFGATVLVSTPAHLRGLSVLQRGDLPPLRRVFSSGAPLARATARELLERLDLAVTEVYGSSETGGIGWRRHDAVLEDMSPEPAWTPLPGVVVEAARDGRLLLRSPFLPPEAAQPYPCEDRVELEPGGAGEDRSGFHLRGRLDGVVKIAGKRVALAEVEHRLLALPAVADAAVVATETPGARGHELVAAVVPRDPARDHAELVAELRRGLLAWFDPVVVPRRIRLVPALPREPSGKLTRRRLHALLGLQDDARDGALEFELRGPVRRLESADVAVHEVEVGVPVDLVHFRGHFDGLPVLPAVAQLAALVVPQVARMRPELGRLRRAARLKFSRPIAPGDALLLRIEVRGEQVRFSLARAGEVVSAGTLEYEARGE
jgi:acyl-coenzyme A synthetase/AMP-(fatty) acid ligase/3-hydroxymyristoyl/3-hydroxydecanoyl-(acyl carrier protein) dehydratase